LAALRALDDVGQTRRTSGPPVGAVRPTIVVADEHDLVARVSASRRQLRTASKGVVWYGATCGRANQTAGGGDGGGPNVRGCGRDLDCGSSRTCPATSVGGPSRVLHRRGRGRPASGLWWTHPCGVRTEGSGNLSAPAAAGGSLDSFP